MKKLISILFLPSFALLCSCEKPPQEINTFSLNEKANALFVEGATKANSAVLENEQHNIKEALALLEQAFVATNKILIEYPQSDIAVGLMANKEIGFGSLSYTQAQDLLASIKDYVAHIDKYGNVGEFLYGYDKNSLEPIFDFFYGFREPDYELEEGFSDQDILRLTGRSSYAPYPILNSLKATSAPAVEEVVEDIALDDVVAVSAQIKSYVKAVAYDKDALSILLEMSKNIDLKPSLKQVFEPNLPEIKGNIERISYEGDREKAYLDLSKIYANFGSSMAATIALSKIKDDALNTEAWGYYADRLLAKGNVANTLDLVNFIKSEELRNDILVKATFASTDMTKALEILSQCTDEQKRRKAIVKIVATTMTEDNLEFNTNLLANSGNTLLEADLEVLCECLHINYQPEFQVLSRPAMRAMLLGEFAVLFAPYNEDFASKLVLDMLNTRVQTASEQEKALVLTQVFDTLIAMSSQIDVSRLINSLQGELDLATWQKIYLKFAVYNYLNNNIETAEYYMGLVDKTLIDPLYIKVALLKANRAREEILEFN